MPEEVMLDVFTREAVLAIAEKLRKHETILRNLDEELKMTEKRINGITVSGTSKAQPMDVLLIERLKNIEEKVNKLEGIANMLKIPKVDRDILEKLK
jgi:hypothetical protein